MIQVNEQLESYYTNILFVYILLTTKALTSILDTRGWF